MSNFIFSEMAQHTQNKLMHDLKYQIPVRNVIII